MKKSFLGVMAWIVGPPVAGWHHTPRPPPPPLPPPCPPPRAPRPPPPPSLSGNVLAAGSVVAAAIVVFAEPTEALATTGGLGSAFKGAGYAAVRADAALADKLDSFGNKVREAQRRLISGDEEAFYGKGGRFAPKTVQGFLMDMDLASGLKGAAEAAATADLNEDQKSDAAERERLCRQQVATSFARGAGRADDAAALKAGELPINDRLNFKVDAYCSWKSYNQVIQSKSDRIQFREALGRKALRTIPTLARAAAGEEGTASEPARGHSAGSLTKAVAGAERLLGAMVEGKFIAGWAYTGDSAPPEESDVVCVERTSNGVCSRKPSTAPGVATGGSLGGFPDAVDIESWEDGGPARFYLLLDDEVSIQSSILLQEEGTRFYPQHVGSVLQAYLQETLGSSVSVRWEEYYMDPRRSSDPDLFDPRQVLMEWQLE